MGKVVSLDAASVVKARQGKAEKRKEDKVKSLKSSLQASRKNNISKSDSAEKLKQRFKPSPPQKKK